MKLGTKVAIILLAAGPVTVSGLALARTVGHGENDTLVDLAFAKISLTQAIEAAEATVGGRASRAELDGDESSVAFLVEVMAPDHRVVDVKVNARDGKILSSLDDDVDRTKEESRDESR